MVGCSTTGVAGCSTTGVAGFWVIGSTGVEASCMISFAFLVENHDLKLSRNPEKNPFAFFHHSCKVSLAWLPKFSAHSETLFCMSCTIWAHFSGSTVQANPLIEPCTTHHADLAMFVAISAQILQH